MEPVIERAIEPVIERAIEPVIERAIEPVIERAIEPVIERAIERAIKNDLSFFAAAVMRRADTMSAVDLALIQEINRLWYPVFPYLARHIGELYRKKDGSVLDIGPFSGVSFWLIKEKIGTDFSIASFPRGMADFFRGEVRDLRLEQEVNVVESSPALHGIEDNGMDLAVFRGAFFFPSIFESDLRAIYRVLRPGGVGFVGGGFGKQTPNEVILSLGKRSRELNLDIGKIELSVPELARLVEASGLARDARILEEGGLWVLINKGYNKR